MIYKSFFRKQSQEKTARGQKYANEGIRQNSNHQDIIKTSGRNYFPQNHMISWFPVSEDKGEVNRNWEEEAGLFIWD